MYVFTSGIHCEEEIKFCKDTPCSNTSSCIDTFGGFQCQCDPDWTGLLCNERVTPCTFRPCLHDGICTVIQTTMQTTYSCTCVGMWEGINCEDEILKMMNGAGLFLFFQPMINYRQRS